MTAILGFLALILSCIAIGILLLREHCSSRTVCALIAVTLPLHAVATFQRFWTEILHPHYVDVSADSYRYLLFGRDLWLRSSMDIHPGQFEDGTQNTYVLAQHFYAAFGDHTALVFASGSALGLIGQWCLAAAVGEVRTSRSNWYIWVVAGFPTTQYWTASFGKDSVTVLAFGIVLLVLARSSRLERLSPFGAGAVCVIVLVASFIRLDIGIVLAIGLLLALVVVTNSVDARFRRGWLILAFAIAPLALIFAEALNLSDPWGIIAEYSNSYERTLIGGSQLTEERPDGIVGIVVGAWTAVVRPFPWEGGIERLISSLDTVPLVTSAFMLGHALFGRRDWNKAQARTVVCALFISIAVFSQLIQTGNLGLLIRLRSLIVPVLILAIAALPPREQSPFSGLVTDGSVFPARNNRTRSTREGPSDGTA